MPSILGSLVLPGDEKKILNGEGQFVAAPVRRIFQYFADASTPDNKVNTIYANVLAAGELAANGQSVQAVYAGDFAANSNQKKVWIEWFGAFFAGIDTTGSSGAWRIEVLAVRVSAAVVRLSVTNFYPASLSTEYLEVTGLTLANAQNLLLKAETPDADGGDLTARMAVADWHAAI